VAGSVKVLTDVLALSEPQSFAVGQKLRDFVQCFIKATPVFDAWAMEIAALLSQVGYVTIPRTIIEKRSRRQALTEEEARMVLQVPQVGHDLISHIPRLARAAKIVLYQHKNCDGSGFPEDGVSGEEIPYGARLFRILLELIEGEGHYVTKAETVLRMRSKPHYFDAKLVDLIEKNLAIKAATPKLIYVDKLGYIPDRRTGGQSAEAAAQSPAPIREINLAELQPGDRLASDVSTFENLMVVAAGSEITPLILTRIVNFGSIHRLRERVLIVA